MRHNLIRVGAAALIPEMLKEQGVSAEAAFGRARLRPQTLSRRDMVVPLMWLGRAFNAAAAAAAQAEFGLLVGLRFGSRFIDTRTTAATGGTRVSTALMHMISQPAIFPNALLSLNVSGDTCTIGCSVLPRAIVARGQLSECALGFATGALRVLCGPKWTPGGFRFAHAPPSNLSRHIALLQASASFDQPVTAMEFESAWLDRDVASEQDPDVADIDDRRIQRDFVSEVHAVLASWSLVDKPTAPAVAAALGVQPRTLNRLLGVTGASFIKVLEATRYKAAQQMLRDAGVPVVSVAWSLGYSDASAFSRAFRRWSGMTPTEWRQAAVNGVQ